MPDEVLISVYTEEQSVYDNPYTLMSRSNGKDITEFRHLLQSIVDLLTTPIGTRVDDPNYGSSLNLLLDRPFNASWRAKATYYTVTALSSYEPRLQVTRMSFKMADSKNGKIHLDLYATYRLGGAALKFQNMELDFKKQIAA